MQLEETENNTLEIFLCHLVRQIYSPDEGALRARLNDPVRPMASCI